MGLLDGLRAAKKAGSAVLDASKAYSAGRQAYEDGASLPEIVDAFARETDSKLDDEAAQHLKDLLESTAVKVRELSVALIRVQTRLRHYGPKAGRVLASARRFIEKNGPRVEKFAEDAANKIDPIVKAGTKIGDLAEDLLKRRDQR